MVAEHLAAQGAQLILLVRKSSWVVDYVNDMRERTNNMLIHIEEVDLESLHSVRTFATTWLNNTPPRRLDMIICLAGVSLPPGKPRSASLVDGVETHLQVNYLSHFHLVTLMAPSLRVQPPDRDVRVIMTTCVAAVMGDLDIADPEFKTRGYPSMQPWKAFGASKLLLTMFAYEFQRRLNTYERPDKAENNVRLIMVDPGLSRTPSFRLFVSFGTITGLLLYIIMWPIWWLFLKSPYNAAQTHLYAAMSPDFEATTEMFYTAQCKIRDRPPRSELADEELQKLCFDNTEKFIESVEKRSALARKREALAAKAREISKNAQEEKERAQEKKEKAKKQQQQQQEDDDEKQEPSPNLIQESSLEPVLEPSQKENVPEISEKVTKTTGSSTGKNAQKRKTSKKV